jgi:hypothetical protein
MDDRFIIGAMVHVLGWDGYNHKTCHAGIIVRILDRGGQVDIYLLPYPSYKNRTETTEEVMLAVPYNPSIDVIGCWHWPNPEEPLCKGYV